MYKGNPDEEFAEILGKYIHEHRKKYRGTDKVTYGYIASKSGIDVKNLKEIRKGKIPPKRTLKNLAKVIELNKEKTGELMEAAGYKPFRKPSAFEIRVKQLADKFRSEREREINDYREKISSVDEMLPDLSNQLKERIIDEYSEKIEKIENRMGKFDILRENFKQLMSMTDEELRVHNSNDPNRTKKRRLPTFTYEIEIRDGVVDSTNIPKKIIEERKREEYDKHLMEKMLPNLYNILTNPSRKI